MPYDEATRQELLNNPELNSRVNKYINEHRNAILFFTLDKDSEEMRDFLSKITPEAIADIKKNGGVFQQKDIEEHIAKGIETGQIWEAFNVLMLSDAVLLYDRLQHKPTNRALAQASGALEASEGLKPMLITSKNFRGAFDTKKNKFAYVAVYDAATLADIAFSEANGEYDDLRNKHKRADIEDKRIKDQKAIEDKYDPNLLSLCAMAAYRSMVKYDNSSVTVYLPKFLNEMGLKSREETNTDLLAKLRNLENVIGVMNNEKSLSRAFVILDIDQEKKQATFSMPYLYRLIPAVEQDRLQVKKVKGETIEYSLPSISWLLKPTIVKVRNKPAIHIVRRIVAGLQERGTKPDVEIRRKKGFPQEETDPELVTYSISYKTILNDIPMLKDRLEGLSTSNKNNTLKRAFTDVPTLLMKETEVCDYYRDLEINMFIPTMTTLGSEIRITHRGKNPAYKSNL